MQVSALAALSSAAATSPASREASNVAAAGFGQLFEQGIAQVDSDIRGAEKAMGDLAAGRATELHEVMISLEKARISVQTFIQVRNKVLESYQDLMRMQM